MHHALETFEATTLEGYVGADPRLSALRYGCLGELGAPVDAFLGEAVLGEPDAHRKPDRNCRLSPA